MTQADFKIGTREAEVECFVGLLRQPPLEAAPAPKCEAIEIEQAARSVTSADNPLPAAWLSLLHEVHTSSGYAAKRQTRILVVDDIDTNREIVAAYLVSGGYRADAVGSAAEAIEVLENESYDLVLMDIQMPVMDGVAATRRIRSLRQAICDVPIIAMTGNVFPDQVRSYLQAGMNGHVGKPLERAKLYKSIERCLSERRRDQLDAAPILPETSILSCSTEQNRKPA